MRRGFCELIALGAALVAAGSVRAQGGTSPAPSSAASPSTSPSTSAGANGSSASGANGSIGSGAQGASGATGALGASGNSGASGALGATGSTGASGGPLGPLKPPQPQPPVARFGKFDIDQPLAQLALLPELKSCAADLLATAGHAECALPLASTGPLREGPVELTTSDERISKLNLTWDDSRPGGEILALRLTFDPQFAPPLTDLEGLLTRGWGPPVLEQLRRDRDNKIFTLQWEDPEHRAILEAAGLLAQPSRAIAIVLERKPRPLPGELANLRPRPFPNMRIRMARRLEYDGQPYAVVWGTSLSAAQEALGESGPAWSTQRSYVGLFKLEPPGVLKRRWKPLWERTSGDDEDNDLQRITRVDTHDVTGDSDPDLLVELSCPSCGQSTSEVVVKTVRGGKAVDLLDKHDLYRAQVDARPAQIRIREAEGDDAVTVSTYAYDKSKGAFVLAREEREPDRTSQPQ